MPTRKKPWIVYANPPFAGPAAVLAYLSCYTHRVAISNRRLLALDERGVTFRYKDYRREGVERYRTMTLPTDEFIRRFLLHVLPRGFHCILHYGLLASGRRRDNLAHARKLLAVPPIPPGPEPDEMPEPADHRPACPCCGGRMLIIETFERFAPRPARTCTLTRTVLVVIRHGVDGSRNRSPAAVEGGLRQQRWKLSSDRTTGIRAQLFLAVDTQPKRVLPRSRWLLSRSRLTFSARSYC